MVNGRRVQVVDPTDRQDSEQRGMTSTLASRGLE